MKKLLMVLRIFAYGLLIVWALEMTGVIHFPQNEFWNIAVRFVIPAICVAFAGVLIAVIIKNRRSGSDN